MTITLTREEAQQVLECMETAIKAGDWVVDGACDPDFILYMLRTRLSAPEPEPVRLRRGDILRCIETNELCTVWATSTTGKTLVKWKANDFGEYTAEQIGDLFWIEPKSEPEPVAWMWDVYNGAGYSSKGIGFQQTDIPFAKHTPLYTAPPQREWQGLTDAEVEQIVDDYWHDVDMFIESIEAKLKEKNT